MAGARSWRPLPLSAEGDLPPLLVAFEIKGSEYSIQVTDMAHVWKESMERKAICIRAWSENTSIDPSDTPENMSKFLQTLQSALDESNSGQATITLSPGSSADSGEGGLQLVATCPLAGFESLRWPFHLRKSSSAAVAHELTIPLVNRLYSKSFQIEMLMQALKHKDAVIAKLSDKLEATGTGLEHVFTALSGRKKVTREAADDKIRGLAPFNERKMNDELQNKANQPNDAMDLVHKVFGDKNALSDASTEVVSENLDGWWLSFVSISSLPRDTGNEAGNAMAAPNNAAPSSPLIEESIPVEDDSDGFQIQSTPPRLKSKTDDKPLSEAPAPAKPNSSTHGIKQEPASSQEPKRAARIGAIGGKKHVPSPSLGKETSPPQSTTKAAMADDDETASETASDVDETASLPDEVASSPPPAPSPLPTKAAVKKSGLGRIGGTSKLPAHDAETSEPSETGSASSARAVPTAESRPAPPKKLGVIGKRIGGGAVKSGDATENDVQRGRTTSRNASAEATEGQRETSQERADRKREELKKELEKKAAAGPAKKKRKF